MDWDDEQTEEFFYPPHPTLPLAFASPAHPRPCQLLLVALYGPASLFARSLIGNATPINRLNFSRAKQQSLADLYEVGNDLYLVFNQQQEPMKEIPLADFLHSAIAYQRAILLTAFSSTTLKHPIAAPLAVFFFLLSSSPVHSQNSLSCRAFWRE